MLSAFATELFAIGLLCAMGLLLVVWAYFAVRRLPFGPVEAAVFGLNYVICRIRWRASVSRPISVPDEQGAVIVCNHRCPFDPSFIYLITSRLVCWMVAKEYFSKPLFAWFLRFTYSIPVGRGGSDTAATRQAIRLVAEGGLLGMFPEGRINRTDQILLPGRPGAALIALKARVPVVPCYISGSQFNGSIVGSLLLPAKVHVKVGEPIDLSPYYGRERDREVLRELTERFLKEIARLADDNDFQPQLAGRFYKPGLADE